MSEQDIECLSQILKHLKSSSSTAVYKGLYDVRYKLLKSPEGVQLFRKNNGADHLFRFVKKPNEKILDISLSILANLCLEDDFRSEVAAENEVTTHVLSLLSCIQKDSIVGRACRLLGNLATSKEIAIKLNQKGVVPKLVECIKAKDSSPATKHMAVRALRLLWEAENNKSKMLQDQVVQTVASLLPTVVDELLQAVLKALKTFTFHCNEQCALQIQGDGKGFEDLVASITHCSKSDLAVSVILNLCFVSEVRPLLGTAGVVEAVMNLFNGTEPQQYSSDLVSVLCLLCRESVNRSKVRRAGGLEILLESLRSEIHPNLEARALNAIIHFIYDELGLQLLIKEGLVPILVQKLVKVVNSYGSSHKTQLCLETSSASMFSSNDQKRIRLDKDCDPLGLRAPEASTSGRMEMLLSGHWSPGSSRSIEFSPDASRTYSPPPLSISYSPTSSALSPSSQSPPPSPLSDAYSPVCGYSSSEDENQEEIDADAGAEVDADSDLEVTSPCLKDQEDIEDIQEALNASLPVCVTSRHGLIESWCLLLLSRVSHMDSLVEDMVSSSTIESLLQYYTLLEPPHPRAARVLQRITRNYECLVPLLRSGLVLKVNTRLIQKEHQDCSRCLDFARLGNSLLSQMSMLAESGFGEGQIVHHLMRAPRPVQAFLIISVPYIIRTRRLLRLMLNCKVNSKSALDLLLQLVTDECGDGLSFEAIDSVTHLVQQSGIISKVSSKLAKTQLCSKLTDKCSLRKQNCLEQNHSEDIVILSLDNGASVLAKRGVLCQESPMFAAMFSGSFCESESHCVPLKDVTEESLKIILSLMCAPSQCYCCLLNSTTEFVFEVLKLADRFILPKVVNKVADWLLSQLSPDVVPTFYVQAQNLRHVLTVSEKISQETLLFSFNEKIDLNERQKMFSKLLNSECKHHFTRDISDLIKLHYAL